MEISRKTRTTAIAIGLGLFIAAGLFVTVAAQKPLTGSSSALGSIPESVTAPAEQLGKAFAAVANHVKPAVVSVYSEKTVKLQLAEVSVR